MRDAALARMRQHHAAATTPAEAPEAGQGHNPQSQPAAVHALGVPMALMRLEPRFTEATGLQATRDSFDGPAGDGGSDSVASRTLAPAPFSTVPPPGGLPRYPVATGGTPTDKPEGCASAPMSRSEEGVVAPEAPTLRTEGQAATAAPSQDLVNLRHEATRLLPAQAAEQMNQAQATGLSNDFVVRKLARLTGRRS